MSFTISIAHETLIHAAWFTGGLVLGIVATFTFLTYITRNAFSIGR